MSRYKIRKRAFKVLEDINEKKIKTLIFHYASESFKNNSVPAISCISIYLLENYQVKSFYLMQNDGYKSEEEKLLIEFESFIQKYKDYTWLHWNCSGSLFGFEVIKRRFKYIFKREIIFEFSNLVDLSQIFNQLYTPKYIEHGKFLNIVKYNGTYQREILSGEEEAELFSKGNFVAIHNSCEAKVRKISSLFELALSKKLKHKARWCDVHGITIDSIYESKAVKLTTLILAIWGFISMFFQILKF
ncbi:MAG: hypothetical protein PHR06_05450 [Candidatus Cloacimonetes bacterium]|nr:hypothetical protein [Candidatus Cloacimonadota bacterium]